MDATVQATLATLKQWHKAMIRLRNGSHSGGKGGGDRQTQVNRLSQQLVELLTDPAIAAELNQLMAQASQLDPEARERLRAELLQPRRSLVATEKRSIEPIIPSGKEWNRVMAAYRASQSAPSAPTSPEPPPPTLPTDADTLAHQVAQMQTALLEAVLTARQLGRKPKKRYKRKITLGIVLTTIGVALLVGNTQVLDNTPNASYILGGNALFQAMRDFVGDEVD